MFDTYIIKKGDTLKSIANMYGVSSKVIEDINNLYNEHDYRDGMEIVIPKENKEYFNYYVIEKGDSIYGIARRYNINPKLLASLNGLNDDDYIYPNQQILIPKSNYSYYITAEGDTLDEVIKAFGSTKDKFLQDNKTVYLMKDQLLVNKK